MGPVGIMNKPMKKGQILTAKTQYKGNDVFHPVIYIQDHPERESSFLACIISTKPTPPSAVVKNIEMEEKHFNPTNEWGNKYKITYNNSHLVQCAFVKELNKFDIDASPCGELSDEGIKLIEELLPNLPIITYDHLIHELTEEYVKETSISFLELLKK